MGLERILQKIKEFNTILIHGHIRPDGDCLGSQFGLQDIIRSTFPNKKVYVVGENSEYLSFLGQTDIVEDDIYEGALAITVDVATTDRVSDKRFLKAKEIIKIDHHIPVEQFGNLIWVDEDSPSCAQMIAYFYNKFRDRLVMTKRGATSLYTGIVTDTGGFRYRGVDQATHQLAGMLISKGANPAEVDKQLSVKKENQLKLKGHILTNFVKTDGGFVYFIMKKEVIEKYNMSYEDASATVNELANIQGYPVWALVIEYPTEIRVRLRSNGPEIASVANKFEGGGHSQAAGCRLQSFADIKELTKEVEKVIRVWR